MYLSQIQPDLTIFEGIPPLIIEIIAKSTRKHDLETKLGWYQNAKIPEIWLINPQDNWIRQYCLKEGNYTMQELQNGKLISCSFPSLGIQIKWLWQYPLPKIKDLPITKQY